MKQNILILAYNEPLTTVEIANALGIPTAYVESAVTDLVSSQLMRSIGNRYCTDFMIVTPEQLESNVNAEIEVTEKYYLELLGISVDYLRNIRKTPFYSDISKPQKQKLEYYFLLHLFSSAIYTATQRIIPSKEEYPPRPNGGKWIAVGTRYPQNIKFSSYKYTKYCYGGERRAYREWFLGARSINLRIYDMQPDLNRYERGPIEMHDDELAGLLYIISRGIPFDSTGFDPIFCENIPHLVDSGVLAEIKGKPFVNIPILKPEEYDTLDKMRLEYMRKMTDMLVPILRELLPKAKIDIPAHLEGRVAEFRKYSCYAIPMAFIKSASEKGDLDTEDAIPPMVFIVDDDNIR